MTSADTIQQLKKLQKGKSVTVTLLNATSQDEANYKNEVSSAVHVARVTAKRKGMNVTLTFTK